MGEEVCGKKGRLRERGKVGEGAEGQGLEKVTVTVELWFGRLELIEQIKEQARKGGTRTGGENDGAHGGGRGRGAGRRIFERRGGTEPSVG